jgi:hypothetical protein
MSPSFEILSHKVETVIVHSLIVNGEEYTKSTEIKTKIKGPKKNRHTSFMLRLGVNNYTMAELKEWRINGKVNSTKYDSPLTRKNLRAFKQSWFDLWKPKIQMKEVVELGGKPLDELELREDYEQILRELKEYD